MNMLRVRIPMCLGGLILLALAFSGCALFNFGGTKLVDEGSGPSGEPKTNMVFYQDYENCKPGARTPHGNGFCTASDEKHVLGKLSACINCGRPPGGGRGNFPPDLLVFEGVPVTWDKEAYIRWYLYLNKEFDLPDVADGYWPAPKCFGLKTGEGWALHFMTDKARGMYTSTYIAKAGEGFRIIVLSQENPPEEEDKWLDEVTPEFKKRYEDEFPFAAGENVWRRGSGQGWQVWNPNYFWAYGTKDGERSSMIRRERWYCIELHIKAATGHGKKDGMVELWLDGKSVFSRKDVNNDQGSLSKARLRGGIHDHDRPVLGSRMYIDNVVVDTKAYIGPAGQRSDLRDREASALEALEKQQN